MNSWNNITLFCFDCCVNTVSNIVPGDLDFADHCWHVQGGVLILVFLVRIGVKIGILTKLLYPKTKILTLVVSVAITSATWGFVRN